MKVFLLNRGDVCAYKDGKLLPVKIKNDREYVDIEAEEGEKVTISFLRRSEFSSGRFFLYALFFWIIGIAGLFTPKYNKFLCSLSCTVEFIADSKTPPVFMFTHYCGVKDNKPVEAVRNTSEAEVFIDKGVYVTDPLAEKNRKIYRFCSAIARIAVLAFIISLII